MACLDSILMRPAHIAESGGIRYGLVTAGWLLALAGLLAMHALGTHGTGSHESSARAMNHSTSAMAAVVDSGARGAMQSSAKVARTSQDDPPPTGTLLGLCLVVLAGALTLFLLALLNRRAGSPWVIARRPAVTLVLKGRERDPPCLTRLSVMRC
jgi:hypothetical protein